MNTTFTRRSQSIDPFEAMVLLAKANELEALGHHVIHLEVGEPNIETALPVLAAARKAIDDGKTHYTPALGLWELREAIAQLYFTRYQLTIDPKRIIITPGGSGALLLISGLLIETEQNLLMTDPGYPCNRNFLRLVGADAKLVPVDHTTNYQLSPELLDQYWDEKTAGILIASPANPTGTILNKTELAALSESCKAHKGYLISDEIYHGLTYDQPAPSALEADDEAFILNSFSKYYGMTGWRLGWIVAPSNAITELEKFAQNIYISPSSVAQYAALACFQPETERLLEKNRLNLLAQRNYLLTALRELGFLIKSEPQGAFYLYADVSNFTDDSYRFCTFFLENQYIAFTPGIDFGDYKANTHVRFSYAQDISILEQAVERIAKGLKMWNK